MNIAITGVGGGVGQSIIKSLYGSDYNIIGLDGDLLAAGLYAVPKSFLIPYANSETYIPNLINICSSERVNLLFPGLDAELRILSLNREHFRSIGTTVIVSDPDVIDISDDKMLTFQKLKEIGIKVPNTQNLEDFALDQCSFPIIIKQRIGGARSKNVFFIKDRRDYDKFLTQELNKNNYIVQQYIDGDEYTCGSITLNGECKGVIVMRRTLRDGDTYKCFSVKNTVIEETVRNIVNVIKPFGACNVQLRFNNGIPYIFEINARCSGTTASRTLCGFNEPKMIADYLLKGIEPSFRIEEKTILRYWKELVIENGDVGFGKEHKYFNLSTLQLL